MGLPLEPARAAETTGAGSAIERARQHLRRLQDGNRRTFPVHEQVGLYGVYRRLGVDRCNEILTADDPVVERNAQLLLESCEQVLIRDDQGEETLAAGYAGPLDSLLDITIVRGADMGEARQLVLGVFGGDQQLLCDHAADVHAWMVHAADDDFDQLAEDLEPGG